MTHLEEQSPPEAEIGIMSGSGTSLSKKQKLFGGIAAFAGLVVVGFGGFTMLQGVNTNAAGEAALGRSATTNPATNESRYFRVKHVSQQAVEFAAIGEARQDPEPTDPSQPDFALLAQGWRIERSQSPDPAGTWKPVSGGFNGGEGAYSSHGNVDIDSAYKNAEFGAPTSLQPETDYYYRITQRVLDESSQAYVWKANDEQPIKVTTSAYPKLSVDPVEGSLVKVKWTEGGGATADLLNTNPSYYYRIVALPAPLVRGTTVASNLAAPYAKNIDAQQESDRYLKAADYSFVQTKGTTAHYALVLNDRQGTFVAINDSTPVTVGATASDSVVSAAYAYPSGTLTIPWTKLDKVNLKFTQLMQDRATISQVTVKNAAQPTSSSSCNSQPYGYSPHPVAPTTFTLLAKCFLGNKAGTVRPTVTVQARIITGEFLTQSLSLPAITVTRVDNNMTAAYSDTTIKVNQNTKLATATIKLKSGATPSGSCLVGKVQIKDLTADKIIGTQNPTTICQSSTSEIKVGKLKAGKLKLAVIYTDNNNQFKDKTINLPVLTVSK